MAGLIGGDENFGRVMGNILGKEKNSDIKPTEKICKMKIFVFFSCPQLGLAVEGFAGGGGAVRFPNQIFCISRIYVSTNSL